MQAHISTVTSCAGLVRYQIITFFWINGLLSESGSPRMPRPPALGYPVHPTAHLEASILFAGFAGLGVLCSSFLASGTFIRNCFSFQRRPSFHFTPVALLNSLPDSQLLLPAPWPYVDSSFFFSLCFLRSLLFSPQRVTSVLWHHISRNCPFSKT